MEVVAKPVADFSKPGGRKIKGNQRKKLGFCLDFLVRNEPFQWVALTPWEYFLFFRPLSRTKIIVMMYNVPVRFCGEVQNPCRSQGVARRRHGEFGSTGFDFPEGIVSKKP
jgi:hypothetical protein